VASWQGFKLFNKNGERFIDDKKYPSVVAPTTDASYVIDNSNMAAGFIGYTLTFNPQNDSESQLIRTYRELTSHPEVDNAIDDIVCEAIVKDEDVYPIHLILDYLDKEKYSEEVKQKIHEAFDHILKLMKFNVDGYDYFRQFYVDGRIYFQIITNKENLKDGIVEVRPISPYDIRKVATYQTERQQDGMTVFETINEHFVYATNALASQAQGIMLPIESVAYATSGLYSYFEVKNVQISTPGTSTEIKKFPISYLHKAIKPINQMRMMEDSLVIYRITRAPERRVFYIDVENLPKLKAEQYIQSLIHKYRNKMLYDASTGQTKEQPQVMSMQEDIWLSRRNGKNSTEVAQLTGGQNLGNLDDVIYFQKNMYRALNVPLSRINPENGFSLGKASEITRDEIKFGKMIDRLQSRFAKIFHDLLRTQLLITGVIDPEDWEDLQNTMVIKFNTNSYFEELKDAEILTNRIALLEHVQPYIGKYFTEEYVKTQILKLNAKDDLLIQDTNDAEEDLASPTAAEDLGNTEDQTDEIEKIIGEINGSK